MVVSPDGNNVYVASLEDEAITEFARNADGSLTEIGCIADSSDTGSTCSNQAATGLIDPEAIAISPDGKNVYVAAHGLRVRSGDIAEFTRNADGRSADRRQRLYRREREASCPVNERSRPQVSRMRWRSAGRAQLYVADEEW